MQLARRFPWGHTYRGDAAPAGVVVVPEEQCVDEVGPASGRGLLTPGEGRLPRHVKDGVAYLSGDGHGRELQQHTIRHCKKNNVIKDRHHCNDLNSGLMYTTT